eukprot:333718-Chlamydomonas_euryale.AAC.2
MDDAAEAGGDASPEGANSAPEGSSATVLPLGTTTGGFRALRRSVAFRLRMQGLVHVRSRQPLAASLQPLELANVGEGRVQGEGAKPTPGRGGGKKAATGGVVAAAAAGKHT